MFNLTSLSLMLLFVSATPINDSPRTIALTTGAGSAGAGGGTTVLCATGEEEDEQIVLSDREQLPKIWIGVRVCTVPEALAAHVKRGTLMLVNIAENSPAERAGLDRYDIVLSVNDRALNDMKDLLDAIQDNGADRPARMVVIQGGAEKTLTVTPVERDPAVTPTFKYEEQEVAEVDPLSKYFGHRLKLGPDGEFLFTPQGRLDRLPDDIKSLLDELPDLDWEFLDDLPSGFSIELDEDLPSLEFFIDTRELDESARLTIEITEDGKSITIRRGEDGKFSVERQSADGTHTSQSYDDREHFRTGDPEAYKIYRKSVPHRGVSTFVLPPDLKNLGKQQREFQLELKTQIERARQQVDEALEKARETRRKIEVRRREDTADNADVGAVETKTVTLAIVNDQIRLTITEDGVTREYEFDSREAFRKSEPELYERYKSYLDEE